MWLVVTRRQVSSKGTTEFASCHFETLLPWEEQLSPHPAQGQPCCAAPHPHPGTCPGGHRLSPGPSCQREPPYTASLPAELSTVTSLLSSVILASGDGTLNSGPLCPGFPWARLPPWLPRDSRPPPPLLPQLLGLLLSVSFSSSICSDR